MRLISSTGKSWQRSFSIIAPILFCCILLIPHARAQKKPLISIEMVTVGDAGNPPDTTGHGAVPYPYRIGKYDVTLSQYAAFLNAVATKDPYGLYNPKLATDLHIAGISRSGESGSYTYSVIGSGNRPITYLSWFSAARFVNWLNNGATAGANTEAGAYTLNGATSDGLDILKNANAQYWIPSEDEWYKAAYYDPTLNGDHGV